MQEKKVTIFPENLKYFLKMEKKLKSKKLIFCFANTKYSLKLHSKAGNVVDETSEYIRKVFVKGLAVSTFLNSKY